MKNKILILHENAVENAKSLDDKSLGEMISACAQVLCEVHRFNYKVYDKFLDTIPLSHKWKNDTINKWVNWIRTCLSNYNALLAYARACCEEIMYRFSGMKNDEHLDDETKTWMKENNYRMVLRSHKHHDVIEWLESNRPALSSGMVLATADMPCSNSVELRTPFPLVMPDQYWGYSDKFELMISRKLITNERTFVYCPFKSYRNYYRAKIKRKTDDLVGGPSDPKRRTAQKLQMCGIKFTRREIPDFLGDL